MESRFRFFKIITTPTTTEIYEYENPVVRGGAKDDESDDMPEVEADGTPASQLRMKIAETLSKLEGEKANKKPSKYDRVQQRERQAKQNRWNVARIIECNKGVSINDDGEVLGMKFLTLTIAEDSEETRSVKWCNHEFRKFMKRLNRYLYGNNAPMMVKYLAVNERQKRGVWHYHVVLFDFPYVPNKKLAEIWGLGFVDIRSLETDREGEPIRYGVATYISKYFTKQDVVRGYKQKTFFKSQNLTLPKVVRLVLPEGQALDLGDVETVYSKEYERPYFNFDTGECEQSRVTYTKLHRKGNADARI